jgi:hypothetical protein
MWSDPPHPLDPLIRLSIWFLMSNSPAGCQPVDKHVGDVERDRWKACKVHDRMEMRGACMAASTDLS